MNRDILTKIEEQAALYSLGMLSQTEARAFEREVADGNETASASLNTFERVVTQLSFCTPEAAPSPNVRTRLLAQVTGTKPPAPSAEESVKSDGGRRKSDNPHLAFRSSHSLSGPPSPLVSQFLNIRASEGSWKQMAEGVFIKTLFVDRARDTITMLVRLAPGGRLPRHRHHGAEESIVIEGDCRVNGDVHRPGDYRCAPAGSVDSEVTTEHGTMFLMISPREIEILRGEGVRG